MRPPSYLWLLVVMRASRCSQGFESPWGRAAKRRAPRQGWRGSKYHQGRLERLCTLGVTPDVLQRPIQACEALLPAQEGQGGVDGRRDAAAGDRHPQGLGQLAEL